ncbi:MAG: transglycosylase domain-containing protein, partial [Candidatus Promineifilaceae bacterium]
MSDDKHSELNPDEQPTIGFERPQDKDAALADQILLPADKPPVPSVPPVSSPPEKLTITIDDLFDNNDSNPDDEDTLPPHPMPPLDNVLAIEALDDEDENTMVGSAKPFILDDLAADENLATEAVKPLVLDDLEDDENIETGSVKPLVLDNLEDDENTATGPIAPSIPDEPDDDEHTVTGVIVPQPPSPDKIEAPAVRSRSKPRRPEPPQFTPNKRPPVIDAGATQVNPKVALPKRGEVSKRNEATRDSQGRSAEDVRRRRRAAREAAERQKQRDRQQPPANPTLPEPSRPKPPPRKPQTQPKTPKKPPQRELAHNANRVATRDSIEDKAPIRGKQERTPNRVVIPARPKTQKKKRNFWGCLTNFVFGSLLLLIIFLGGSMAALIYGYINIANDLPPVRELEDRTSTFQTVFIYDGDNNLLYSITDPTAGDRTRVPLDQIDPDLINATIATEDARFWANPGFDPISIARAVSNVVLSGSLSRGEIAAAGGASTITQQLVRATLLSQDEANQTTVRRKVREIILAAELNRQWTRELGDELLAKQKILEIYLNEIYYGNRSYGIEAASRTYFKKSAANLTLAEASMLAGLPQAPALWDPITAPEYALGRQSEVLGLMVNEGYVTTEEAQSALNEVIARGLEPPSVNIRYPHFTLSVLSELENTYGSDILYNSGFKVYTTLRPEVQELAEQTLTNNRAAINARGANNAALVALNPTDSAILAMVGSLDYRDESIRGQVNMARAPRQPGSTIKPFVFLASMLQGYTPATLFWDVPTAFPDGINPDYEPKNYDNDFHGPMLLRTALANSYNIPAVKALEAVGVCEFITLSQAWGLNLSDEGCEQTGNPRNVGLALSLGGDEISPLNMASAYAMLANEGDYNRPFGIRRIDVGGQTIYADGKPLGEGALEQLEVERATSAELAYLTTDILADNNARIPEFGPDNLLNLSFPVAAKTGTSGTNEFDVRDTWTIGYTPDLVTAIWVGNTDNEPLFEGASGYRVATPVWNQFMNAYHAGREARQFVRPEGVIQVEVCRDSGVMVNPECGEGLRRQEVFNASQPPLPVEQHFYDATVLDRWTLREANEHCDDEATIRFQSFDLLVSGRNPEIKTRYRSEVETWLQTQGSWWANQYGISLPLQQNNIQLAAPCEPNTERPIVRINEPSTGELLTTGLVQIGGQATAPGFAGYQLEYGFGTEPTQWFPADTYKSERQSGGLLGVWNTNVVGQGGDVTLRLTVFGADNPYTGGVDRARKETRIVVRLLQPTAQPTNTPPPTATPVPPTAVPPTAVPATTVPTVVPPTTAAPPTAVPPTTVPTVAPVVPATDVPTAEPPTTEAPTAAPTTAVLPTDVPPTDVP